MLTGEAMEGRSTTTIPHLRCTAQHQSLCQGRPLWYLLLSNPGVHSFVQSRWLDRLFPVLAQDDGQLLLTQTEAPSGAIPTMDAPGAPELSNTYLHVMGVSCAPPVLYAHSDGRGSRPVVHEDSQSSSPFRQSAYRSAGSAAATVNSVTGGHSAIAAPHRDFAQAPFSLSAAHGAPLSSCTIPTAAPQMTAAREKLLHDYQRILETPNPPLCSSGTVTGSASGASRPQSASAPKFDPSHRGKPMAPLSDDNSVVVGGTLQPHMMTRVSSTKLLRDEIERVRQMQQPVLIGTFTSAGGGMLAAATSPSVTTLSSAAGGNEETLQHGEWRTPLQARYATWIQTSHSRSQRDRFLEVAASFCDAITTPEPSSVLQQLLAPTLQHPIVRNKAALEQQWAASGTDEIREERELALLQGQYNTSSFFDVSELTLLELRVFGYAPASLTQSSRGATIPSSSSSAEFVSTNRRAATASPSSSDGESLNLLSAPQDLVKQRLAIQKLDPLDRSVTVELLLRNARIRGAIRVWWDHLPKYQIHRPTSAGLSDSPLLASARRDGPEVIKRTTFDQVACLIHAAYLGGSLSGSSTRTVNDLLQLAHDDWLRLFLPWVSSSSSVAPAVIGGKTCGSGSGAVPILTDHHRSLLARGAEAPLCITLDLFEVALLSLLEPWMETILCEERELCLAMLFPLCFAPTSTLRGSSVQFTLRSLGDTERSGAEVRRGARSPPFPRGASDATRATRDQEGGDNDVVEAMRKEDVTAERRPTAADLAAAKRAKQEVYRGDSRGYANTTRSVVTGASAATALLTLAEQLDTASDLELARKQAERNRWEDSDKTLREPHSRDAWRREVLFTRVQNEQRRGGGIPTGGKPNSQPLIGRTFVPHDLGKAYGLERVMIQRLSKQVSETGRPEDLAAIEHANIVVHATKRLIPPYDLHHIAKYHQPVVGLLRETVNEAIQRWPCGPARSHRHRVSTAAPPLGSQQSIALETPETGLRSEDDAGTVPRPDSLQELTSPFANVDLPEMDERCGGVALAAESRAQAVDNGVGSPAPLVDVTALAALLSPPAVPRFQQLTKCKEGDSARAVSAMYVRRPQSACGTREKHQPRAFDSEESSKPQTPLLQRVSESVRRPLSAVRAQRMKAEVPPTAKPVSSATSTAVLENAQSVAPQAAIASSTSGAAVTGGSRRHVLRREAHVEVIYVSPYMRKGFLPVSNGSAYSASMRSAGGRGGRPQSALR